MDGLTLTLMLAAGVLLLLAAAFLLMVVYILRNYTGVVIRIFEEKPLFVIPRGQPIPGAENVRFPTAGGLKLAGSYLRSPGRERRGVILFGTEFGSNRWSCHAYCKQLLAEGYDVFTFEFRNTGDSDAMPGYEPLQWVTEYEVEDVRAAVEYLKSRPDAEAHGIGFFGISRGGGAGILVAAEEPWIRCVVTDGAFATLTTMIPYMRKWVAIYSDRLKLQNWLPNWFYSWIGRIMLRKLERRRQCRFPSMEDAVGRLSPRPLLMIHGGSDTYIKPAIARNLYEKVRGPKEFWLIEGAKHNQAIHAAADEYHRRVVQFFHDHLAPASQPEPSNQLAASA